MKKLTFIIVVALTWHVLLVSLTTQLNVQRLHVLQSELLRLKIEQQNLEFAISAESIKLESFYKSISDSMRTRFDRPVHYGTISSAVANVISKFIPEIPVQGNMERCIFEVTMYTNAEGAYPYAGKMANGKYTHSGACAAPIDIPFGSIIALDYVPEKFANKVLRILTKEDNGGAIKRKVAKSGNTVVCVDIWTDDHDLAVSWGRREIPGFIVKKED